MRPAGFTTFVTFSLLAAIAIAEEQQPAAPTVDAVLAKWALISQSADPVDLDQYLDRYGDDYPEAVLKYAAAFFGPVDGEGLKAAFRWTVMEAGDSEIRLRATPRKLDRAAVQAATSVSSEGQPTPPATIRGDFSDDALAFDVIIDRQFTEPRLVRWLNEPAGRIREAVLKLDGSDLATPESVLASYIEHASGLGAGRDIEQTSMMVIENATAAQTIDPVVLEILSRWEQAAAELKSVEMRFDRIDYDNIFEVETRGKGRFVFISPDQGLYELKPGAVVERADGRSAVRGGKFVVTAAKPQMFLWSGESVTIVDGHDKTYNELPIPKRLRNEALCIGSFDVVWQMLAGPQKAVPGVVDIRSEKLVDRFFWKLIGEKDDEQIVLEGRPRTMPDRRHMSRLDIILDGKTCRTAATKLVDPSASHETVHVFEYVNQNTPELAGGSWKPDMKGFAPVGPPPMAPPADSLPNVPPPQE
jgi:hypothetical protein